MSSFFGRYLKVEFPEIGKSYLSDFDKDENGDKAPRIKVDANFQKNAYVQGKVSVYGLNEETRKLLQERAFTVDIYAGWNNTGNSQIISAEKKFFEVVRVGSDIITNIYFLSYGMNKIEPDSVPTSLLSTLISNQASKFNYQVNFDANPLLGVTVSNISLVGNLQERLDKLKTLFDFEYYEQAGQIIIAKEKKSATNVIDIDASDGILSIPAYSDVGQKVNFRIMFNNDLRIGRIFKVTNKYARINIGDTTKSFAGDLIAGSLSNIKDINFRVLDISYSLDTMGDDFNMQIEGIKA